MKKLYTTLTVLSLSLLSSAQTIIYVDDDANGSNDGTSWANAYTDLHTALGNNTVPNAQIWIAEGFYTRISNYQTFTIDDNESLFGGFNGTETNLNQRDFYTNETIISGDVGWNDQGQVSPSNSYMHDNAKNIITIHSDGEVQIDGVILEHAYSTTAAGGAIYVSDDNLKDLTVSNCIIRDNISKNRAGISFYSKTPNTSFKFFNNRVENNINVGDYAYTIEYRTVGTAGINSQAHIVNNLFRNNYCMEFSAGGSCGRFTNLVPGTMDIYFINNTVIDNPQGSSLTAPFAYEFGSSYAATNLTIANNIFYDNINTTQKMALSIGAASQLTITSDSDQNVQDFSDIEGISNTHILSASPFIDYPNNNLSPVSAYQTTGSVQVYSNDYPTIDLAGNPRKTGAGQIGLGAYQAGTTNGFSKIEKGTNFLCYPNPFTDELTIEAEDNISKIIVYNAIGQPVKEINEITGNKINFDTSDLKKGSYILRLTSEKQEETTLKLIK